MSEQLFGTETEWEVRIALRDAQLTKRPAETGLIAPESSDIQEIILETPIPRKLYEQGERQLPGHALRGVLRANGGRLYDDHGHPEESTPLCSSLKQLVGYQLAGERAMWLYFMAAKEKGVIREFEIGKRVADRQGNSWGYHENYLMRRKDLDIEGWKQDDPEQLNKLAEVGAHLATRPIYTGQGGICRDPDPAANGRLVYAVSQKATTLTHGYTSYTTHEKGVVNTRDTPYADPGIWVRLHVTCPDPNISPWATQMSIGTMLLNLARVKHRIPLEKDLPTTGKHLLDIAKTVAVDTTCKRTVELADGTTILPVDIQYILLGAAHKIKDYQDINDELTWALEQWEYALDTITDDPMRLADRADWPLHLKILEQHMAKRNVGLDHNTTLMLDMLYSKIWELTEEEKGDPKRARLNLPAYYRAGLWKEWMPSEELIAHCMVNAPEDNRSWAIGQIVKRFAGTPEARVDWKSFYSPDYGLVRLDDPTKRSTPQLNRILRRGHPAKPVDPGL